MEEFVGELWHKAATRLARSDRAHYAARLADIEKAAPIFFRALGGHPGTQIHAFHDRQQRGVRRIWQRIAGADHDFVDAQIADDQVLLPESVQSFNDKTLNDDLYWWWLAAAPQFIAAVGHWCQRNRLATQQTLQRYPALRQRYEKLVTAHITQRQQQLGLRYDAIEQQIANLLIHINDSALANIDYSPSLLPIALWFREADALTSPTRRQTPEENTSTPTETTRDACQHKRKAQQADNTPQRSPIVLFFKAESILSWAENLNINRSTDDEDEDNLSAADDLQSIAVTQDNQSRKSRIKFDLDLPAAIEDDIAIGEGWTLPEWDYKKQQFSDNVCRVVPMIAKTTAMPSQHDHLLPISRKLKRQFQALQPNNVTIHHQADGHEIELDETIRFIADRRHHWVDGSRLYQSTRKQQRDLSCLLLADLSRSTETFVNNEQRVIDVIKDALLLFGDALNACRDPFEMHGFYSLRRDPIRLYTLKTFTEAYNQTVRDRVIALRPGFYTRVGAAVRAASARLAQQHSKQKLLILLSDGKPNDMDHYEGRFGIEDTRHAILEARQQGITPFCVTIDEKASAYLPYMFGQQHFIVVRKPQQLPEALLQVYRLLTR